MQRSIVHAERATAALVASTLAACAGGSIVPRSANGVAALRPSSQKITHVVIIFQENRSFDNLFQGFPGADTRSYGFVGRKKVRLRPIGLETTWDVDHSSYAFFAACDGTGSIPGTNCRMDHFNRESVGCGHASQPACPFKYPEYAYVPHSESKPYFDMGKQYVVADRMYTSDFDGASFVSHQYIIAGQASSSVNYPFGVYWGCDDPGAQEATITQSRTYGPWIVPCFNYKTLGDELDKAGVSWHFYTASINGDGGIWSAYQAVQHIRRGPDWNADVITPQTQFLQDAQNGALPAVSWVTPTCENSDHAGCGSNTGPAWVASLVNAIGESQYWNSTAIFLMWDDYGGWYDHVPPPYVDYDGLGIRVPLVIISPYAKKRYVSHVQYEHGSILKFIEDLWGLPRMAASDSRANSPAQDCFNFNQQPRNFVPFQSLLDRSFFMRQRPDRRPPDTE